MAMSNTIPGVHPGGAGPETDKPDWKPRLPVWTRGTQRDYNQAILNGWIGICGAWDAAWTLIYRPQLFRSSARRADILLLAAVWPGLLTANSVASTWADRVIAVHGGREAELQGIHASGAQTADRDPYRWPAGAIMSAAMAKVALSARPSFTTQGGVMAGVRSMSPMHRLLFSPLVYWPSLAFFSSMAALGAWRTYKIERRTQRRPELQL